MNNQKILPSWERDFAFFFATEKVIILEGWVNDKYLSHDLTGYSTLSEFLTDMLNSNGYTNVSVFNPASGFSDCASGGRDTSGNRGTDARSREKGFTAFANKLFRELNDNRDKRAYIVEDASFLCVSNTRLNNEEHDAWSKIRTAIKGSSDETKVFFIFENASDIPRALDGNSGLTKRIIIPKPDNTQRKQFISLVFPYLSDDDIESLSDITADIPLRKMQDIFQTVCNNNPNPGKIELANYIKQYIYGYSDSPWEALAEAKVVTMEDELGKQIKGQEKAIRAIAKKVKLAWSGIGSALDGDKAPKGIAMLCGPTGVGKTELAKQLTRIVMGDPNLLIRIDANEYAQEHTAQRLVGSPPGYVGYEQGGQLTNAVNERPFAVILVDEIEKAHFSFWDYFMQVLQDGRLTDGRGNLCVFNNTFLIFTTNLGAKEAMAAPDGADTEKIIYEAIEEYFSSINRREIFGRLKKHIIPFNFITDDVACQIVEKQLKNFQDSYLASKRVRVNFSDEAVQVIEAVAGHSSEYGGRDIKNTLNDCLESQFVDIYLNNKIVPGSIINITGATATDDEETPLLLTFNIDNSGATAEASAQERDTRNTNRGAQQHAGHSSEGINTSVLTPRKSTNVVTPRGNQTVNVIPVTRRRR